ncbi:MAG: hypothetical protein GYB65_15835 [Chloroflexi bacterium]|nr:hypothetical protein [Chloroflexota bacterium]
MRRNRLPLTLLLLVLILQTGARQPPADQPYTFVWVGDTLLADAAQEQLHMYGYLWPFAYLDGLLAGDFAIANAEGPITPVTVPFDPDQRWSYNAEPLAATALAQVGFDALGLANNHAMDRGGQGIADTAAYARAAGLAMFGAGTNRSEAERPLLVETPYGVVGIVGLGMN